jgi:Protein of unknown function (DUF2637)
MNLPPSAAASAPPSSAPPRNWPRLLVNALVTLVVLAVAAVTFVLSYAGVHAIALQGGVSVQLARLYPGLFDAVLVIACVAAVVLRDARWWARAWAWLVVIVILGAIGAADVLNAANYALQHRPTEGVVAAAPVVAVLLAFSLLLTVLRQTRPQAAEAPPGPRGRAARRAAGQQPSAPIVTAPLDAVPLDTVSFDAVPFDAVPFDAVPVAAGAVPRPPAPPMALPPAPPPGIAETQVMPAYPGDAGEAAETGQDLPAPDEAPTGEEAAPETSDAPLAADTPDATDTPDAADGHAAADSPAVDEQNPSAEPTEAVGAEASPAADAEPTAEPAPQPAQAPRPESRAIRYASSAASESGSDPYWESEVDPDLAGQVYPVLTSDPDIDTSGYHPGEPQDVDDTDAPPFATAPFASVPRLNRMRVSPIPPTDENDDEQG